ncbi:hypothetical protein ACWCQQ_42380 [Streptomyces sp. NPDC002143]
MAPPHDAGAAAPAAVRGATVDSPITGVTGNATALLQVPVTLQHTFVAGPEIKLIAPGCRE